MKLLIYFEGDSGGPIHQWLKDHWEQVGLVSYGNGCASPEYPGVYTRLSTYYTWILSHINGDNSTIVNATASTVSAYTETVTVSTNIILTTSKHTSFSAMPTTSDHNSAATVKTNLSLNFIILSIISMCFIRQ